MLLYDDLGYPLLQMSGKRVGELKEVDGRIVARKALDPVDLEDDDEQED